MSIDSAAFIALILTLALIILLNRKKLSFSRWTIFYAAMYRSKAGIATMDRLARKYKNFLHKATPFIIAIGFIGMAFVMFDLARGLLMVLSGTAAPSVGVVLPFKAKGVFYVPFFYWIVSIFLILIIHEGMHGVMSRAYNLPVKNSGIVVLGALLPLVPGAFVEPDEKKLIAAPRRHQLAVYAAGPVANIITGVLLLLAFSFALSPISDTFYSKDGVIVTGLMDGHPPAEKAGMQVGEKITAINGQLVSEPDDFSTILGQTKPGDSIDVVTTHATYDITLGENPQSKRSWLGVYVENPLKAPTWATHVFLWVKDLIFWLAVLSLGVGLFNLIPLGPVDGGRMFLTALQHYTHEARAQVVWKSVSFVLLGILLTNVVMAFV
ncbi:site-2 protease family protein [Candidatus Woesearchaeota archaeon]|nr:site-2 protease family protein [Candidatus Woesearchaeota archaeon]